MEQENVSEQNASVDTPVAQTLTGNNPIESAERVLIHGSNDHRIDHNCKR